MELFRGRWKITTEALVLVVEVDIKCDVLSEKMIDKEHKGSAETLE